MSTDVLANFYSFGRPSEWSVRGFVHSCIPCMENWLRSKPFNDGERSIVSVGEALDPLPFEGAFPPEFSREGSIFVRDEYEQDILVQYFSREMTGKFMTISFDCPTAEFLDRVGLFRAFHLCTYFIKGQKSCFCWVDNELVLDVIQKYSYYAEDSRLEAIAAFNVMSNDLYDMLPEKFRESIANRDLRNNFAQSPEYKVISYCNPVADIGQSDVRNSAKYRLRNGEHLCFRGMRLPDFTK